MSLNSNYNKMKEFNKLLISFKSFETKKPERQLKKERIMKNTGELYGKYYSASKSDYDTDDELKKDKKKKLDYKWFEIIDKKKQKSEWTEMLKPLWWFKINRKEFEELIGDIYNNQDNNDFKIKINKKTYDLENVK